MFKLYFIYFTALNKDLHLKKKSINKCIFTTLIFLFDCSLFKKYVRGSYKNLNMNSIIYCIK